jgi:hypothetical protein
MHSFSLPCLLHALPTPPALLDHSTYMWRRFEVMNLLIIQFSPSSYHFNPLGSKYFQTPLPVYFPCQETRLIPITKLLAKLWFLCDNSKVVHMLNLLSHEDVLGSRGIAPTFLTLAPAGGEGSASCP